MYLHESMKELDQKGLVAAMVKELTDHMDNGKYSIIPKSQVTTRVTILVVVWKMKL